MGHNEWSSTWHTIQFIIKSEKYQKVLKKAKTCFCCSSRQNRRVGRRPVLCFPSFPNPEGRPEFRFPMFQIYNIFISLIYLRIFGQKGPPPTALPQFRKHQLYAAFGLTVAAGSHSEYTRLLGEAGVYEEREEAHVLPVT